MSKIQLGAKIVADPRKADAALRYDFIPDIMVEYEGEEVSNESLGKEKGIWLVKRYLTAGERSRMNARLNADASLSLPMVAMWETVVLEIHGIEHEGREVKPSDIVNAVGSPLANGLITASYWESVRQGELTGDERKN